MAAGDQLVIRATPAGPLNAGYTTSASQSIEVTSAVATFDGTSAAGGFEPALAFYDANGVLLNRAMCKTTIAAGSSAEVSFFPFVQAASATTPTPPAAGVSYGALRYRNDTFADTGFGLNSVDLPAGSLVTTDSTIIGQTTSGGFGCLSLKKAGQYLVFASVIGSANAAPAAGSFVQCASSSTLQRPVDESRVGGWFAIDAFGDYQAAGTRVLSVVVDPVSSPPPQLMFLRLGQNSGLTVQLIGTLSAYLMTTSPLV